MMARRIVLITALVLGVAHVSFAQAQPGKTYRVGFLGSASPTANRDRLEAFRQGLREPGYTEGRNILIEYRWADGHYERLPGQANELVGRKPDLIISTGGRPTLRALRAATKTIPVVFLGTDPVGEGIVLSIIE